MVNPNCSHRSIVELDTITKWFSLSNQESVHIYRICANRPDKQLNNLFYISLANIEFWQLALELFVNGFFKKKNKLYK